MQITVIPEYVSCIKTDLKQLKESNYRPIEKNPSNLCFQEMNYYIFTIIVCIFGYKSYYLKLYKNLYSIRKF